MSAIHEEEAAVGKALNRAAALLPVGYTVRLAVEKGAGWAELETPAGEIVGSEAETLSDEIDWCIAYAIEDAAAPGVEVDRG